MSEWKKHKLVTNYLRKLIEWKTLPQRTRKTKQKKPPKTKTKNKNKNKNKTKPNQAHKYKNKINSEEIYFLERT